MRTINKQIWTIGLVLGSITGLSACHKFLAAPNTPGVIVGSQIWSSDSLTASVLNTTFSVLANGELFDGSQGMSIAFGLYADELQPLRDTLRLFPQYTCSVSPNDYYIQAYWNDIYRQIYDDNSVIEGAGSSITLLHKNQWLGEAYFLRAIQYFYLTNVFGDLPLAVTTDYTVNNNLSRSLQNTVYAQIAGDLKMAVSLLDEAYHDVNGNPTNDHGRPNRAAAETVLARVDLYQQDWPDAEAAATAVIVDPQYNLGDPAQTFLANSAESIWQLAPSSQGVGDFPYLLNNVPATLPPNTPLYNYLIFRLTDSLVNAFEPGDARMEWVRTVSSTTPAQTFHLAAKYTTNTPGIQYIMMCRLAELYLVRSEARARQGDLAGALADLNVIRTRAQLPPLTTTDAPTLLSAIAHENRIEFFCEEAHRFFDLRRTGALDAVEIADEAAKNSSWQTYKQYWPIPPMEIANNPNLTQTPGY